MLQSRRSSPGKQLRDLIAHDTLLMPGVFNAISALSAQKAGARGLYITGAGITNAGLGVPDIGLATLNEFASQAAAISAVTSIPALSDADTGFGSTWNVYRTVQEMERACLAGIHLEDQVMPKRCGHLDGKSLVTPAEMAQKVATAISAKSDPDFMIVARTDARGVEGLDAAIDRAKSYLDAGADGIFPEGLESEAEFSEFRKAVPGPLLANMTEFGKTPLISTARFRDLGYQMVIFPMTAFRTMLKTLERTYGELVETGTQKELLTEMKTRQELYELLNYSDYIDGDRTLTTDVPTIPHS